MSDTAACIPWGLWSLKTWRSAARRSRRLTAQRARHHVILASAGPGLPVGGGLSGSAAAGIVRKGGMDGLVALGAARAPEAWRGSARCAQAARLNSEEDPCGPRGRRAGRDDRC